MGKLEKVMLISICLACKFHNAPLGSRQVASPEARMTIGA